MKVVAGWRRSALLAGLAALVLAGFGGTARAGLVTVEIGGTVTSVDEALSSQFAVGDSLSAVYTFESTTAARSGSTSNFAVFDALTQLGFSIGAYTGLTYGAPEIQVDNDVPRTGADRYGVVARSSDGLVGDPVNDIPLTAFGFRLDDSTGTVFSDALILPTSLNLADFDSNAFFLFFDDGGPSDLSLVTGSITSLRVTSVPEPSTIGLACLAAVGLVGTRFRRSMKVS